MATPLVLTGLVPREDLLENLALESPKVFGRIEDANAFRWLYLSFTRHWASHTHLGVRMPHGVSRRSYRQPPSANNWSLHILVEGQYRHDGEVRWRIITAASIYRSEKKILRLQQQIAADMLNPEIIPPVVEKMRIPAGKEQRVVTLD